MQESNQISAVIIAKNEEKKLPRLLKSLGWVDEILVADTGSQDNTKSVAAQLGAKVIELSWQGFGVTKQRAVEAASSDWIFSLDADEEVSPELQERLGELKKSLKPGTAYKIRRISWYLGKKIKWCGWQKDQPLRLFYREEAGFNSKLVHEGVKTKAQVVLINEPIYHYTYPQLQDHWQKINIYTSLNVEEKFKPSHRYSIAGALFQGFWKFIQMYFVRQGFRDGKAGFLLCYNSAIGQYIKYLKLWEKQQNDITH